MLYYPNDGSYQVPRGTRAFAVYQNVEIPRPQCRKYHITGSSDDERDHAKVIADTILPYLREQMIAHKVVADEWQYIELDLNEVTAGKLITLYMQPNVSVNNVHIQTIAEKLALLQSNEGIKPYMRAPRFRHGPEGSPPSTETQLDALGFIFGGFLVDPKA